MRAPIRRPMWTDDPVRDEMAWQAYLEEQNSQSEEDDYDPWEEPETE